MATIRELSTITSKGQLTLPKAIRQALGVGPGQQVAFELQEGRVVVTPVQSEENFDPAIGGFLSLLEQDIRNGRNLVSLSPALAQAMQQAATQPIDLEQEIDGDVVL